MYLKFLYTSLQVVDQRIPRHPSKQYRLLPLFSCSPELDSKTLWLKIPHSLVTGHGETWLCCQESLLTPG